MGCSNTKTAPPAQATASEVGEAKPALLQPQEGKKADEPTAAPDPPAAKAAEMSESIGEVKEIAEPEPEARFVVPEAEATFAPAESMCCASRCTA
mmetsp:Transcript_100584/g.217092  ORF Transcript_100584/g.217092 Transcript_100584/m.217092 type:complete len:95 (+) Transcript_100584:109-393(+)